MRFDRVCVNLGGALEEPHGITVDASRPARPYDVALGELGCRRQAQPTCDFLGSQLSTQPERHVNIRIGYDNLTVHSTSLNHRASGRCRSRALRTRQYAGMARALGASQIWRIRAGLLLYSFHHAAFAGFAGGILGSSFSTGAGAFTAVVAWSAVSYRVLTVDLEITPTEITARNRYITERCRKSEIVGLASANLNRFLNFAPPAIVLLVASESGNIRRIKVDASAAVGRSLRTEILQMFRELGEDTTALKSYRDYRGWLA